MVPDYCVCPVIEPCPLRNLQKLRVSSHTKLAHLSTRVAPPSCGLSLQNEFSVPASTSFAPMARPLALTLWDPAQMPFYLGKLCLSQLHRGSLFGLPTPPYTLTAVGLLIAGPFFSLEPLAFLLVPQDGYPVGTQYRNSLPQTSRNASHHPSK